MHSRRPRRAFDVLPFLRFGVFSLRNGQLNRHTKYRPATTLYMYHTKCVHAAFFQRAPVLRMCPWHIGTRYLGVVPLCERTGLETRNHKKFRRSRFM